MSTTTTEGITSDMNSFWKTHDDELIGPSIIVPSKKKNTARKFPILDAPEEAIKLILVRIYEDQLTELQLRNQAVYYSKYIETADVALETACATTPGFARFCDKSNPENKRLRSGIFEALFDDYFTERFPGLKEKRHSIYGVYNEEKQKFLAEFVFERFFKEVFMSVKLIEEDSRMSYFSNEIKRRIAHSPTDTRPSFPSEPHGSIYATVLFHIPEEMFYYVSVTSENDVAQRKGTGAQIAKEMFDELIRFPDSQMLKFGGRLVNLRNADGTIFDGRKFDEVINHNSRVAQKSLIVENGYPGASMTQSIDMDRKSIDVIYGDTILIRYTFIPMSQSNFTVPAGLEVVGDRKPTKEHPEGLLEIRVTERNAPKTKTLVQTIVSSIPNTPVITNHLMVFVDEERE